MEDDRKSRSMWYQDAEVGNVSSVEIVPRFIYAYTSSHTYPELRVRPPETVLVQANMIIITSVSRK